MRHLPIIFNTKTYGRQLFCLAVLVACLQHAGAQTLSNAQALLDPPASQYFQNQYLANPAMAGLDSTWRLNAAYRKPWTGIEGAPVTQYASVDGAFGRREGLGLNVFHDKAGLLSRTRAALSYAYSIPLSETGQQLRLGFSLAMDIQRVDNKDVDGDITDPSIGAFNNRRNYFEGELGAAYLDEHVTLQASAPNLRTLFGSADKGFNGGTLLFFAASYKFTPQGAVNAIEPKFCYRVVQGYDHLVDGGINISFMNSLFNVLALYHSSKSFTAGIGLRLQAIGGIQAMYTTQTGGLGSFVNGGYEVGATINLFKVKK